MNNFPPKIRIAIFMILTLLTVGFAVWQVTEPAHPSASSDHHPVYHLLVIERTADNEHALYQFDLADDGQIVSAQTIFSPANGYQLQQNNAKYLVFAKDDGTTWEMTKTQNLPVESQIDAWTKTILDRVQPLSGPREFVVVPNSAESTIFVMTGEADNTLNLYLLDENGQIQQLTHVSQLRADNGPLLSASVEFVTWRPLSTDQFLYRVRIRDIEGHDYNQLYLYDLTTRTSTEMPYFGKSPIWSPDGLSLVGARFNEETHLYELYQENLSTGETLFLDNGCNPQFSPDGKWLAYDGHTSSQHQNYTDCFANGKIHLLHIASHTQTTLTDHFNGYAQVIAWQN